MRKPYDSDNDYVVYKENDYTIVNNRTNEDNWIDDKFEKLKQLFDDVRNNLSGLTIKTVRKICLKMIEINPIAPGSYIEFPTKIENKNFIISMQNKDDRCFEYALLSALHFHKVDLHPQRPTKYKQWLNTLSFNGIKFPVEPKEKIIRSIESKNNLAINIFYYENDKVNILYTSNKEEEYNNNINLLILK